MQQQINEYFKPILSKLERSFRQGYSAQHCFLVMIEKVKKIRDNKDVFLAVLRDLLKAFQFCFYLCTQ